MTFTIEGKHIEGTQFKTLARVVGTDGTLLTPDTAGSLLVEVYLRSFGGPLQYSLSITDEGATGMQPAGLTDGGWTQQGVWNFAYTWSPLLLIEGSPPFAFKAPRRYAIRYTFNSPVFDAVKVLQYQTVMPG